MITKIQNIIKVIIFNIFVIIILLLLVEIFSGNTFKKNKLPCSYIHCNANYKYSQNLYKSNSVYISYIKDEYGLRNRFKEIDKIDILISGGSTSDERYLNLQDTWVYNLETLLSKKYKKKINVVSAAIDGQSTYGHLWNFDNWYLKINNFKTKYILFYIGINERNNAQIFDQRVSKDDTLINIVKYLIKKNEGLIYLFYKKFFLEKNIIDHLNVGHKKRVANYKLLKKKPSYKNDDEIFFEKNLEIRLIQLYKKTKSIGAIPIFVTQKSFRWRLSKEQIESIDQSDYYSKEKISSDIVMKVCKKYKIQCANLFESSELKIEDTYDLIHTNPIGSNKIANFIFKNINFIF